MEGLIIGETIQILIVLLVNFQIVLAVAVSLKVIEQAE